MRLVSTQLSTCLLAAFPSLVLAVQIRYELTCQKTHLIHIGKTGGTTLRSFYDQLGQEEQRRLIIHRNHRFVLGNGEPDDCYAFFVRDPVERWVSGFLENLEEFWKKKDPPEEEKFAFRTFKTPTELAEAVESTNEAQRANAFRAIQGIEHTRNTYSHYLPNLTEHLNHILFVGETRNLRHDFETLCQKVGFAPPDLSSVGHHHNVCPDEMEWMKAISSQARGNLRRLLKEDYEIMETLRAAGLIRSNNLQLLGCVAPQQRCVVMGADGQFRMVTSEHSAGQLDIYTLPNATRAEELSSPSGE